MSFSMQDVLLQIDEGISAAEGAYCLYAASQLGEYHEVHQLLHRARTALEDACSMMRCQKSEEGSA